ncbi:MAG: adaptor protein MecA [Lachnospiraceae bacterium]|nr:adaptor protein MecA [Lachnospiraceae bacterium]
MKIERVNDHQIRCTLTKSDLEVRNLKLSELAYGTEKAKNLFRDMMNEASRRFGFEAEDIPLMIEAIPLSGDTIVLIITKVEDPEELDTRFSRFAPGVLSSPEDFQEAGRLSGTSKDGETDTRLYAFRELDDCISAAHSVPKPDAVMSSLYKDNGLYYLIIRCRDDAETFHQIANMLTEYSTPELLTASRAVFLKEKAETMIASEALEGLRLI